MSVNDNPINVLHVDDEPDFTELCATFLERKHDRFEVLTAQNPKGGHDLLANHDIDCVVSDYDMPPEDGIEFLRTVRVDYPDLPFILYTGKGSEEVASEAISAGVTDYLQKESGTDQYAVLANRIRNYVEGRRAENEREYMRERMELALEYTNSIIYEIDLQSEKVSRIGEFEHFFNRDSEELPTIDEYRNHVVHPGDRDEFRQFYRELTDGSREAGVIEYRTNPEAGDERWLRDQIHIEEENPRRALGVAQDITELKEAETRDEEVDSHGTVASVAIDEIERQNQAFEALLDIVTDASLSFDEQMAALLELGVEFLNLDIGIISNIDPPDYTVEHVVTPDGSIEQGEVLDFSDTFCSLVYEADGPVAFRNPETGEVKDHPCYQNLGLQAYLGEPLTVDGTRYGTLNFSSPDPRQEPFSDGEIAFIRTMGEWVTKEMSRRSREEEIRRQNERFDEFASMVSHDLQTPFATARGWVELAIETGDTEDMQKALDALDRADDLRSDLVEVLRTKEIVGQTEPIDTERLGRDLWETVTTENSVSLQVRDAPRVEADPDAFRRMLENLFLNAIEHGGENVTVRIGRTDEGFFIEDDGPGIPEDERDDVFKRGTTTKPDGSGVGLANVREIIMAHNWDVRIVEGQGGGARFEITGVEFAD